MSSLKGLLIPGDTSQLLIALVFSEALVKYSILWMALACPHGKKGLTIS